MFPSQRNGVHEKTRGSHAVGLRKQDKQRTKNETNKNPTLMAEPLFPDTGSSVPKKPTHNANKPNELEGVETCLLPTAS